MQQQKVSFILILLTLSLAISIGEADNCTGGGGSNFAYTIVVDRNGGGNFTSVQAAIDSIPSNNHRWIKVQINPGVYVGKVYIAKDKPCIVLEGQDRITTTIVFNEHDRTDKSATFTSVAPNIVARGITFKNSYDHPLENSEGPIPGVTQAVAARILGDKSAFFECSFLGLQDTLWDALGRHYFYKCHIEGAEDFIFGSGQSFYEDCSINVTACGFGSKIQMGYITAQGRESEEDPSGFVFKGGIIFGTVRPYLGRAYGPYSRVIFHDTTMNADVVPQGWYAWKYPGKEENFMYAEVNCKGPGSDISGRVSWEKKLKSSELEQFSLSSFVDQDGWIDKLPSKTTKDWLALLRNFRLS